MDLAKRYIELQEEEKRIKKEMNEIKKSLLKVVKEKGEIVEDNKVIKIQKRQTFDYDPEKVKEYIGEDKFKLIVKQSVDKDKLLTLVKGGFVEPDVLEEAKVLVRETEALVVKKVK